MGSIPTTGHRPGRLESALSNTALLSQGETLVRSVAMLDWFTGYLGYDASALVLGRVMVIEPGGEVVHQRERWETARGSWQSGVQICRTSPTDAMLKARDLGYLCSPFSCLQVSGNPTKFLQGHNAAGPSVSMLGPVLQAMVRQFAEGLRPGDADDERLPCVHRSRVDVATAADLGSHDAVHQLLELAARVTRSRHGRALNDQGTVYWGQGSRRWKLKMYCKHCELKKHIPPNVGILKDLLEWTRTHVRIEVELYRPELKDRGTLNDDVVWEYARKIEVPTMKAARKLDQVQLRGPVRMALQLWLNGNDVSLALSRASFYRYRREILDASGLDISMNASDQTEANPDVLCTIEELQRCEVVEIPKNIQRSLFGAQL